MTNDGYRHCPEVWCCIATELDEAVLLPVREEGSMTEGAGLRQSHFGSGYDAGKARLQAEVEQLKGQLKGQLATQAAVVEAARDVAGCIRDTGMCEDDMCLPKLDAVLSRLDAADVPTEVKS